MNKAFYKLGETLHYLMIVYEKGYLLKERHSLLFISVSLEGVDFLMTHTSSPMPSQEVVNGD